MVEARGKAIIPTDLKVAVPHGTYGRVAPRSGLAAKNFIDVGAGVVDEDYRGPLGVVLFNHADVAFQVKQGDRIAQVRIFSIVNVRIGEVELLVWNMCGCYVIKPKSSVLYTRWPHVANRMYLCALSPSTI